MTINFKSTFYDSETKDHVYKISEPNENSKNQYTTMKHVYPVTAISAHVTTINVELIRHL